MGVQLNRADLASHTGFSVPTVDRWVKEGCPVVKRGGRGVEWVFDLADIIAWLGDRRAKDSAGKAPSDIEEIEKRTLTAKMKSAELALAREMGEVAPIREFEKAQAAVFAEIRSNCMNIPQRTATQLVGLRDEAIIKKILRDEIVLALEAAANAELTMADEDEPGNE